MEVIDTPLNGVKLIQLDVFGDARGFFVERFHAERFRALGLPWEFAQDNHSRSAPGVLRGLHYQHTPPQGKLVGAASGRIWDVAVDIRPDSPTFGRHYGAELSGENGKLLWMSAGFAHGFCVLGDAPADVFYKCTGPYNKAGEGGILFDAPELNVAWPIEKPLISDRDKALLTWAQYCANPPVWA